MEIDSPAARQGSYDHVYLKDLQLSAVVGQDAWGRSDKPQPVLMSVKWFHYLVGTDKMEDTLSYSKMAKDIVESIDNRRVGFASVQSLAEFILYVAEEKQWKGAALSIDVHLPKALLHAGNGLKFSRMYHLNGQPEREALFDASELYPRTEVEDIRVLCIIGVNPYEREAKQMVRVDLTIEEDLSLGAAQGITSHWRGLVQHAVQASDPSFSTCVCAANFFAQTVEDSSFRTVEALAAELATVLLAKWPARMLGISVEKPSALAFVAASGARIIRSRD